MVYKNVSDNRYITDEVVHYATNGRIQNIIVTFFANYDERQN